MGCYSSKFLPRPKGVEGDGAPSKDTTSSVSGEWGSGSKGLMGKARVLLQALTALKGPDAASQAASTILQHLGCGNVSIIACTSRPDLFLRLSGQGMFPTRTYHRSQILLRADSCAAGLFKTEGPPPAVLYRSAKSAEEAAKVLPKDWEQEYYHSSMRTFLAVPIVSHSSEPMLGVLTLSSCQPGAFWESWWEPLLGIVAAGLVPLMQDSLTQGLVELATHVLSTASICDFVTAVLQRTSLLLESIYNKAMSVRLGLLSPDQQSMLLLLPPTSVDRHSISGPTISSGSLSNDLRILQLPAANTLLLRALASGQPSVVRNTAKFLEGVEEPCSDVFVEVDDVVSSITAAPLLISCMHSKGCSCCISHGHGIADVGYNASSSNSCGRVTGGRYQRPCRQASPQQPEQCSKRLTPRAPHSPTQRSEAAAQEPPLQLLQPSAARWYGCLYVTHQSCYDFEVELPAIVALSKMLTVLMMQCMPVAMAWRELSDVRLAKHSARNASSSSSSTSTLSGSTASRASAHTGSPHRADPHAASPRGTAGEDSMQQLRSSRSLDVGHGPTSTQGGSPASAASAPATADHTIATSSIVETLRRQVQRARDQRAKLDNTYVQELQLQRYIGKGGFGTVYAGTWQGSPVAIKVMYVAQHERQLLKSAMEMAVLSSIQHPNMVRVYACLTDLVEEAGPVSDTSRDPLLSVRYRPMQPNGAEAQQPHTLCNIVVMELCDRGNLHQAMRRGLLHKRLPNKGLVVDMRLLNSVLLQIAHSLQHLHEHGVIHSDVKCENVLLSSSSSSPMGFTCKLGDFGLVRLLMGNIYIRNRSSSGTVAYQAPEVFVEGSKLTPAVDVYAFGIMMYQLYCCRRPYAGVGKDSIAKRVYRQHMRPHFPPGTWTKYQQLAERCWDVDPEKRPRFDAIIQQLHQLLDAAGGPFTCASPHSVDPRDPADSQCLL